MKEAAAATCDITTIPTVANADHRITRLQSDDGLLFPGRVNVTYTCLAGYKLNGPHDTSHCKYNINARENDPNNKLVTTTWKGHKNVVCVKGWWICLTT